MECCLDVLPNSRNKDLKTCVSVVKENEFFDQHLTGSKERTHSMLKLMRVSVSSFINSGTGIFLMTLSQIVSPISLPENDRKFTFSLI